MVGVGLLDTACAKRRGGHRRCQKSCERSTTRLGRRGAVHRRGGVDGIALNLRGERADQRHIPSRFDCRDYAHPDVIAFALYQVLKHPSAGGVARGLALHVCVGHPIRFSHQGQLFANMPFNVRGEPRAVDFSARRAGPRSQTSGAERICSVVRIRRTF